LAQFELVGALAAHLGPDLAAVMERELDAPLENTGKSIGKMRFMRLAARRR
jgi:hypothetical protein